MELKENCKVLLEKGKTQKVACHKFKHKELRRELALHEDVSSKHKSTITDVKTGLRMCGIDKDVDKVKQEDIVERLNTFLRHFTLEETLREFARLDEITD